jgi:hypothetical protein
MEEVVKKKERTYNSMVEEEKEMVGVETCRHMGVVAREMVGVGTCRHMEVVVMESVVVDSYRCMVGELKEMEVVVICKCTVWEERVMEVEEICCNMAGIWLHKELVVRMMVEVGTCSNMAVV